MKKRILSMVMVLTLTFALAPAVYANPGGSYSSGEPRFGEFSASVSNVSKESTKTYYDEYLEESIDAPWYICAGSTTVTLTGGALIRIVVNIPSNSDWQE